MVTSRSVPQQTAQIFSPLAGQKRFGLRFSQMGQDTGSKNTWRRRKNKVSAGSAGTKPRRIKLAAARFDVLGPESHSDESRGDAAEDGMIAKQPECERQPGEV